MHTVKIATVVGARPQFVKAATISRVIEKKIYKKSDQIDAKEYLIHTGQLYDANMSDTFFEEMSIPKPSYHLGISGGSHGQMTGQMLAKLEDTFNELKPDLVLVYGDTNSTLAGALAAAKLGIPIAHVEAGLRSFNYQMPEEINRVLTDQLSHWLFCPTDVAVNNLRSEGFFGDSITRRSTKPQVIRCGDVMYDALSFYRKTAKPSSAVSELIASSHKKMILMTVHRAENTDQKDNLEQILSAMNTLGSEGYSVVFPVHPRTRKMIQELGLASPAIKMIEPVGYFDMICLLDACSIVATDSGGLQKEAYFMGRPCITMRNETEWTELLSAGVNQLVGANKDKILQAVEKAGEIKDQAFAEGLYGDGQAALQIVDRIVSS